MTKLWLLGAALVVSSLLAGPVMGTKAKISHPAPVTVCDPRDPGNPFSKKYEFLEWSDWRRVGAWDDHNEHTCQPIPS